MTEIELKISFNTPAFLGNAVQQGQWRTPPFKFLFRQWWRVVKASNGCNINQIRNDEKDLFGVAVDKDIKQSKIKFKLENWRLGKCNESIEVGDVKHPEVKRPKISASLYLGFGAITMSGNTLNTKSYIRPASSEQNSLRIGFPDKYKNEILETIQLIQWFGTVGSRSRNGWGSVSIDETKINGETLQFKELTKNNVVKYSNQITELLKNDWPSQIGKDEKGLLIWKTKNYNEYKDVLNVLAKIKIYFRTTLKFNPKNSDKHVEKRHIVAYPITHHDLDGLPETARNANQIRFKVLKSNGGGFYGLIYHLPCKVSENFFGSFDKKQVYRNLELRVWSEIHNELDEIDEMCERLQ